MTENTGRKVIHPDLHKVFDKQLKFELLVDEEIEDHVKQMPDTETCVQDIQEKWRQFIKSGALSHETMYLKDTNGTPFELSIFTPEGKAVPAGGRPCLYFIHGGGFVINNRFSGVDTIFECIHVLNAVCVSIEYSRAPRHKAPTQVDQCYTGLLKFWERNRGLKQINFDKIAVIGRSAGAALLVGLNHKILEEKVIKIKCNIMSFPMVDDKANPTNTVSHAKFKDAPFLTSHFAQICWTKYLGENRTATKYTVPAEAKTEELQGFPPTLLEIANADVLRDEGLKFWFTLKSAKVDAIEYSYNGYHCFDGSANRDTNIVKEVMSKRLNFLQTRMR